MNKFTLLIYTLLIYIAIVLPSMLYSQQKMNIQTAFETALENNFSVKISRAASSVAENNFSAGNAGMLPQINATAGANISVSDINMDIAQGQNLMKIEKTGNRTDTYNGAVQLNWTLFDGFAMFISYDRFELLGKKSHIELQMAMEALIRNIATVYYDIIKTEKNISSIVQSIEISQDRLLRASNKKEYGAALNIEVLKAQVDLNADSSQFLQLNLLLQNMKRNFNFLLARETDTDFELDKNVIFYEAADFESLLDITKNKNSTLNKALAEKEISQLDYELVKAQYYPKLSLSSSYNYSLQESDAGFMLKNQSVGFSAGLNASFNLFDGFRTNIRAENAELGIKIAEYKYNEIHNQITLSLANAYDTYQRRKDILRMEQENLQIAQDNFDKTKDLFNLGLAASLDFRQAQLNLQMAENRINEAQYLAKLAEIELKIISGQILD